MSDTFCFILILVTGCKKETFFLNYIEIVFLKYLNLDTRNVRGCYCILKFVYFKICSLSQIAHFVSEETFLFCPRPVQLKCNKRN